MLFITNKYGNYVIYNKHYKIMASKILKQKDTDILKYNNKFNKKLFVLTKIEILSMKLSLLENELLKR